MNLSNNNSNIGSTVAVSTVKIGSAGTLTNSTDSNYTEVVFFTPDKSLCDRRDGS